MGTGLMHPPVPDRVKMSFVIFDIRALRLSYRVKRKYHQKDMGSENLHLAIRLLRHKSTRSLAIADKARDVSRTFCLARAGIIVACRTVLSKRGAP